MLQISLLKSSINISIINFTIVAAIGLLMRYKIGFEFPYFDQKNLLHAHSHFAFAGWITNTIFVFLVNVLNKENPGLNFSKYILIVKANLVCSYGMLISFALQGYDVISICFSSASILVLFAFAWMFFSDTLPGKSSFTGQSWFKAALVFAIVSTAGTAMLAYMMSSGNLTMDLYLSSVYYYLHFQYNGWFFFSCMGLFIWKVSHIVPELRINPMVFILFVASCVPSFFLSVLWLDIPDWLFIGVVVSAIFQFIALIIFISNISGVYNKLKKQLNPLLQMLLLFAFIAMSIKISLQLFSTIPALSELAFGFRTIVIAYLHLVLLAFISVFLLAYIFMEKLVAVTPASIIAIILITGGIFMNELILLIQGMASFTYTIIPYANESLVVVSAIIFSGLLLLLSCSLRNKENSQIHVE